ncbi:MAG: S8 family serine peptidase [Firmicutes bacterium]|nr:S8 family serine peptidase [Bacillota bacterium]
MKNFIRSGTFVILLCAIVVGSVGLIKLRTPATITYSRSMDDFNAFSAAVLQMVSNNPIDNYGINPVGLSSNIEQQRCLFETRRLIVRANGEIPKKGAIAYTSGFDNYHILQFATQGQTRIALRYLNNLPNVIYAAPDVVMNLPTMQPQNRFGLFGGNQGGGIQPFSSNFLTWGADFIGVESFQNHLKSLSTTNDVIVAVLDSGLDTTHGFFTNRIAPGGRNFLTFPVYGDPDYDSWQNELDWLRNELGDPFVDSMLNDPYFMFDLNGHGTHVAGTIVDLTLPNVKILPMQLQMSGTSGKAVLSSIIMAIEYVTLLQETKGNIVAMNMSFGLGSNFFTDDLLAYGFANVAKAIDAAIDSALGAGILSIAAAGNEGFNSTCFISPARHSNAITVSAIGHDQGFPWEDDQGLGLTVFSSWGRAIDIAAPGNDILSPIPNFIGDAWGGINIDGDYFEEMSGTSMAAPHVAAAAALLASDSTRTLTPQNIRDILAFTARDSGKLGWDMFYGHGILNLEYAYLPRITQPITFSRAQEEFTSSFQLSLSTTFPNARIFYTLDGSLPTVNSPQFTTAITISETTIVRAIAYTLDSSNNVTAKSTDFHKIYFHTINGIRHDTSTAWEIYAPENTIMRYRGVLANLEIPEFINGTQIKYIGPGAFAMSVVESVTLPESITMISPGAFFASSRLKNVYAPNVTIIGSQAFISTALTQLTDENFPKLEYIFGFAFFGNFDLTYVNLSNVREIDEGSFFWTSLEKVVLPSIEIIYNDSWNPTFQRNWGVSDDVEMIFVFGPHIDHIEISMSISWPIQREAVYIDGINVILVEAWFEFIRINNDDFYYSNGNWYNWNTGAQMPSEWVAEWERFMILDWGVSGQTWVIVGGEDIYVDWWLVFLSGDYVYIPFDNVIEWIGPIPSYATIKGFTNTKAEEFASQTGNTFIPIDLEFKDNLPTTIQMRNGMPYIDVNVQGFGLQFQWFQNTTANIGGTPIAGANEQSLRLSGAQNNRFIYVVVTDFAGNTITSNFQTPPQITFRQITITVGQNGAVSPYGGFEIANGENITLTITPNEGYIVYRVLVNGNRVNVTNNTVSLTNITANTTISVTFISASEYDGDDNNNWIWIVLGVVLGLVIIGAVVFIILRLKRK